MNTIENEKKENPFLKKCKNFFVKCYRHYISFQKKVLDLKYPLVSDSIGPYILKYIDFIYMGAVVALLLQLLWSLILLVMGSFVLALFLFVWVVFCFILLRYLCEKIHAK